MAHIKHTKNELKAQRDALKRFERYLPTLQLKKQQLQAEVRRIEQETEEIRNREKDVREKLDAWIALLADPVELDRYLRVEGVDIEEGNIAGVRIPILKEVRFACETPDLFDTPTWLDDAIEALEKLARLRAEREAMEEALENLAAELRTTNQRVNLFEKVKIPEARENIRVIRIFLGDEMTAAVARSKIAKGKSTHAA